MMPPTSSFYGMTTPPTPSYHGGQAFPPTSYNLGAVGSGYGGGYGGEPFPNAFQGGTMPPAASGWEPPPTAYGGGMGEAMPTTYGGPGYGWEPAPTAYIGHGGGPPGAYPGSLPPGYGSPPPTNFNLPGGMSPGGMSPGGMPTSPGGSPGGYDGYGHGYGPGGAAPASGSLAPLADPLVQSVREFDNRGYYGYAVAPVRKSTSVWRPNYVAPEQPMTAEAQYGGGSPYADSGTTWSPSSGGNSPYGGTTWRQQKVEPVPERPSTPIRTKLSHKLTPRRRRMDCCKTPA